MRRGTVGAAAATGLLLGVRRVGRRWGSSDDEVHADLPGDGVVPQPMWQSTRAITIDAPPRDVWPWIVQMGFPTYRGGWYTPYWLDRLQWGIRARSADRIVPELQTLAVGDRVPDSADLSVWFTVEEVDPDRALVLHSTRHILKPMRAIDFTWAFVLVPRDDHRSRLVIRARATYAPRWSWLVLGGLYQVGDFLNTGHMLRAIRRRAERPDDAG